MPSSGKGAGARPFAFVLDVPGSFSVNVGGMLRGLPDNAYMMHPTISSPLLPGQSRDCGPFPEETTMTAGTVEQAEKSVEGRSRARYLAKVIFSYTKWRLASTGRGAGKRSYDGQDR